MKKKDLISVLDYSADEIKEIFIITAKQKKSLKYGEFIQPFKNKTLGMIFQKNSTRTRVSFEVGTYQLGGHALFLNSNDLQLGRGETIKDTALVLSRYLDAIMIRTFEHNDVIELAKYSSVPVINGLTNLLHPCQAFADAYTILEHFGNIDKPIESLKNKTLVFIGDGNNVSNSLIAISAVIGMNITICCPKGYEPDSNILNQSKQISEKSGSIIKIENEISDETIKCADVYYTDVWVSMGQENEENTRENVFAEFKIDKNLLDKSKPTVKTMHCLPAIRGKEIDDYSMDGPNSIIFDQAENRMHVQKAILTFLC